MHRQKSFALCKKGPALRSASDLSSEALQGRRMEEGFTLVELLVVISIIALLMAILLPALSRARTQAKRIVCLSDLKQLTLAWLSYGESNNDKIVNGAPVSLVPCPSCPAPSAADKCGAAPPVASGSGYDQSEYQDHKNELPWIGYYDITSTVSDCGKKCAIDSGALWRYLKDYKVYHCPTGMKGETITYSIVDGVNGRQEGRGSVPAGLWKKNLSQIRKSATQLVFVDEGRITADSFAVMYNDTGPGYVWHTPVESWFDGPDARHGNGTTVSFADGHSECWIWASLDTVNRAKLIEAGTTTGLPTFPKGTTPDPPDAAYQDLYKMQIRCWGQLGYTPTHTPKVD